MPAHSAGLLMCRLVNDEIQYFLIHPGGPYYTRKNEGVWSIPKGLPEENEKETDLLVTAQREFFEETGIAPSGTFYDLGTSKTKAGKIIHAWSFLGSWNEHDGIKSNTFELEWPPRSGRKIQVPEADRGAWVTYHDACKLINVNQVCFLDRAKQHHAPMK
ncbi:MAG TPA: NUDIX domain-containing protein [Ohtaekwangia sp.]|nr:NUDIX domain-containing protein [Ohtaekwangia sp.]